MYLDKYFAMIKSLWIEYKFNNKYALVDFYQDTC